MGKEDVIVLTSFTRRRQTPNKTLEGLVEESLKKSKTLKKKPSPKKTSLKKSKTLKKKSKSLKKSSPKKSKTLKKSKKSPKKSSLKKKSKTLKKKPLHGGADSCTINGINTNGSPSIQNWDAMDSIHSLPKVTPHGIPDIVVGEPSVFGQYLPPI